jgi:hypothetical protein
MSCETYGNLPDNIKRLWPLRIAQIGNLLRRGGGNKDGRRLSFSIFGHIFASVGAFTVVIIFSNLTDSDAIEDYNA